MEECSGFYTDSWSREDPKDNSLNLSQSKGVSVWRLHVSVWLRGFSVVCVSMRDYFSVLYATNSQTKIVQGEKKSADRNMFSFCFRVSICF